MPDRNWRHWTGTAFLAAGVVAFLSNWVFPPPGDASSSYLIGFYSVGLVFLVIGWWLRRTSGE